MDDDGLSDGTDDFKIKGAANRLKSQTDDDGVADSCSICLQPVSERAVATPCNHLTFDFLCLVAWLQGNTSCPLCKADVKEVQYDWREPDDFKTYHVPSNEPTNGKANTSRRNDNNTWSRNTGASSLVIDDPSLQRRRTIYREKLFSRHVGANRVSGHKEFTPQSFAESLEMQSRCRAFLRRELQVFSFLDQRVPAPRGGTRAYLIEYMIAILKTNDPKDASGNSVDLVADFVGKENARLLLHEVVAWLRSPYARIEEWDRHVQYAEASKNTGTS